VSLTNTCGSRVFTFTVSSLSLIYKDPGCSHLFIVSLLSLTHEDPGTSCIGSVYVRILEPHTLVRVTGKVRILEPHVYISESDDTVNVRILEPHVLVRVVIE